MPNIPTRVGQYCISHGYIHEEEYLECDYCNEHKSFINLKYRYYNYGFSRRSYLACGECCESLFGPFRLVDVVIMGRAYESILEVINEKTDDKKQGNERTIDYYEAVRIAYVNGQYLRKYLDFEIKDIGEINKCFGSIWSFTYKIVSGEEKQRIKVVNKNPDNLLVQWVPGGMTLLEMLKASNNEVNHQNMKANNICNVNWRK
jgi:hypothetical protein